MTTKERILSNYPNSIDKSDKVFDAIITAQANEIDATKEYTDYYSLTNNVYEQDGLLLEKTISFFSFIEHFFNETDESYKNRFAALFIRGGSNIWGNIFSTKKVFEQYFPNAEIFLQENVDNIEKNLISDGDFENKNVWTLENCEYSNAACFSKNFGVALRSNSILKQTVSLETNSSYFLHFFSKNTVSVSIMNTNNEYWNFDLNVWNTEKNKKIFTCEKWINNSIYFFSEENEKVTVIFNSDIFGFVDYVELYKKEVIPSFSIIAHFEGFTSDGALTLVGGENDKLSDKGLKNYSYYNNTYYTGVKSGFAKDVYEDLLNYLKPVGTKAYIKLLTKEV